MNLLIKNSSFIFFIILLSYSNTFCCVCENFSFSPDIEAKHLENLRFITGKVLFIKTIKKKKSNEIRTPHTVLKVRIKIFKNFYNKKKKLTIWTGANNLACGVPFKKGANYLITFSIQKKKKFKTNICLPTKLLEEANKDILFLEKKVKPIHITPTSQ